MPLSISIRSAPSTSQLSVAGDPDAIVPGVATNRWIERTLGSLSLSR
jgi:hypothetical protein